MDLLRVSPVGMKAFKFARAVLSQTFSGSLHLSPVKPATVLEVENRGNHCQLWHTCRTEIRGDCDFTIDFSVYQFRGNW